MRATGRPRLRAHWPSGGRAAVARHVCAVCANARQSTRINSATTSRAPVHGSRTARSFYVCMCVCVCAQRWALQGSRIFSAGPIEHRGACMGTGKRECFRRGRICITCNQWRRQELKFGGLLPLSSLSFPFLLSISLPSSLPSIYLPSSSYPLPLPSPPSPLHFPILPHPLPCREAAPLNPARGQHSKLPQRGLGRSPSRNRIWCILALKSDFWWQ